MVPFRTFRVRFIYPKLDKFYIVELTVLLRPAFSIIAYPISEQKRV